MISIPKLRMHAKYSKVNRVIITDFEAPEKHTDCNTLISVQTTESAVIGLIAINFI